MKNQRLCSQIQGRAVNSSNSGDGDVVGVARHPSDCGDVAAQWLWPPAELKSVETPRGWANRKRKTLNCGFTTNVTIGFMLVIICYNHHRKDWLINLK